ncbi:putative adipose-regulatory protein-domain-containing protein [Chaetomium sp. MPI-SDFR-AT-0129]|nr:putative adipose-regulatory protein-domain-containing protein [Chaetomium sp. MPI-SDFR-AT-0129]
MLALHLLSPGPTVGVVPSTKLKLKPTLPYLPPAKPSYDREPFASWHTLDSLLQPTRLDLPAFLASHSIVHTSTRPALMPYIDPLASLASRVFFLVYHVLSPHAASTTHLTIPMAEDLSFTIPRRDEGRRLLPESLLLEVQGGQGIQVYDVRVTLSARLSGLRGFMYRWRITAFVLFTAAFWIGGVGVLGGAVLLVGINLKEVKDYDFEEDSEAEDDDDTVRTDDDKLLGRKWRGPKRWRRSDSSPSSDTDRDEGGLGLRLNIKKEEDTEGESTPILPSVPPVETSTEADDEAETEVPERRRSKGKSVKREESVESRDEGVATSSSAQAGSEGARKRTVATPEASGE